MPLNLWDAWWLNIPRIRARANMDALLVAQAAHPDWKIDRHRLISTWERQMQPPTQRAPARALKDQVRSFANWMAGWWGGLGDWVKR